jgi:hypothetical protein
MNSLAEKVNILVCGLRSRRGEPVAFDEKMVILEVDGKAG